VVTVDHALSTDISHIEPSDISDRLLWRDAQQLLGRHNRPDEDDLCTGCGQHWPCPPRRLAERADAASRHWRQAWTVRHDLNGLRSLPGWRADLGERGGSIMRNGTRRSHFD
jgi:hypothetical protein